MNNWAVSALFEALCGNDAQRQHLWAESRLRGLSVSLACAGRKGWPEGDKTSGCDTCVLYTQAAPVAQLTGRALPHAYTQPTCSVLWPADTKSNNSTSTVQVNLLPGRAMCGPAGAGVH